MSDDKTHAALFERLSQATEFQQWLVGERQREQANLLRAVELADIYRIQGRAQYLNALCAKAELGGK